MRNVKTSMSWFFEHCEEVLGASLLAAMAVLAMVNVVTRYFIQLPLAFTEELEINAMVWLTLLGSAAAIRKRKHLRLLYFSERLPAGTRFVVERLVTVLAVALFVSLGYLGWLQVIDERLLGITSESLGYPQWLYTLAIPGGCFIAVLRLIQAEWRLLRGRW